MLARQNCPSWEEVYLSMAHVIKQRSKDPSTQVGAILVGEDNRILSSGYNGTPHGFDDNSFPWGKGNPDPLSNKDLFVIHAELNAILNFKGIGKELEGATAYVTLFPCNECAKTLVQSGIKKVVYSDKKDDITYKASEILFHNAGVELVHFTNTVPTIR